ALGAGSRSPKPSITTQPARRAHAAVIRVRSERSIESGSRSGEGDRRRGAAVVGRRVPQEEAAEADPHHTHAERDRVHDAERLPAVPRREASGLHTRPGHSSSTVDFSPSQSAPVIPKATSPAPPTESATIAGTTDGPSSDDVGGDVGASGAD